MRWFAVLIALLLAPLPAVAQDTPTLGQPIRVLDDETGDYYASLDNALGEGGPGITDPIPYYTFMDMDWLEVTETEDDFVFDLAVVNIEGPLDTVGFADGGFFLVHFRHNDWDFQLNVERPSGQSNIEYGAELRSKFMDAEDWGLIWDSDADEGSVTWDLGTNTITTTIDRQLLADGRGAAPYPGRSLTDFWVVASQRSSQAEADFNGQTLQFPWRLGDRMPDTGIGDVAVPVLAGLKQTGHAQLASHEPFRASNGEATTFLYTVTATNTGDSPDLFSLELVGVPAPWDVELPLTAFELDGGESVSVPVLLTTPFSHTHGGTETFVLEMHSTTDAQSIGRIELGVRYLAIPQPSGHHPEVYLHSVANTQTASFNSAFSAAFRPSGSLYINTIDPATAPETTDGVAVSAFAGLGEAEFVWLIPLDPTLRMGLDFDLENTGTATFRITSPAPMQEVTLDGSFLLRQAGSGFQSFTTAPQLATFSDSGRTWSPGATESFELTIMPQAAGDYVKYAANNELWIMVELSGTGISTFNQNTVPKMESDGKFFLPMFDYQDDISDAFNDLTGAQLVAQGDLPRTANPGDQILFDVDVTSHSSAAGIYSLSLTGKDRNQGQILTDASIGVNAQPTTATILVTVPEDARDGDRVDLFVQAEHTTDPQRRGLLRLVVNVDTDQEWDDDSMRATELLGLDEKDTPAPFFVGIAALGAALVLRRRRL